MTARAVVASGVQPGERVAIWAPNTTEWAIAALAIYSAGAVLVPRSQRLIVPEPLTTNALLQPRGPPRKMAGL